MKAERFVLSAVNNATYLGEPNSIIVLLFICIYIRLVNKRQATKEVICIFPHLA